LRAETAREAQRGENQFTCANMGFYNVIAPKHLPRVEPPPHRPERRFGDGRRKFFHVNGKVGRDAEETEIGKAGVGNSIPDRMLGKDVKGLTPKRQKPGETRVGELEPDQSRAAGTDRIDQVLSQNRFDPETRSFSNCVRPIFKRVLGHARHDPQFPDVPGNDPAMRFVGESSDQTQFDLLWQSAFLLPNDRFTLELVDSGGKVVSTYYYPSPVLPPVSINEMEANPASGDEWVEIFNGSAEPMDLQGWTLNTLKGTSAKLSIPLDRIIPARGFILISLPIAFLNDQGEILELRNDKNLVINVTPEAGLPDGLADGRCWARVPDGQEAWMFQACTKGEANA